MRGDQSERCYRRAAAGATSSAGLVVILHEMLAGDLRRAITAMRNGNMQDRSERLQHAFSILELLQGSLDHDKGGLAARNLSNFYSYLRGQFLIAHCNSDEKLLETQIALIIDVQQAWQQADSASVSRQSCSHPPFSTVDGQGSNSFDGTAGSGWRG